jgi:hypothetical protein
MAGRSFSTHENALTGKGEIDYAVTPHNMLYASVWATSRAA